MKETWGKAFLYGSMEIVTSIGNVIFSPPFSEEIMEVPVYHWEDVLLDALNQLKSEKSGASIIEETINQGN